LKYPKSEKMIYLKILRSQLLFNFGDRYKQENILLIDDILEKSILNNLGNAVF
jgi:hypothetical protein